jgi:monoamine oxidase
MHDVDVVVVGAGAAGLAAARHLVEAKLTARVLEARDRLGGRAWTVAMSGYPLDLGCGWLHSADANEWARIAPELGFALDETPPPWARRTEAIGFPAADQREFRAALERFYARLDAVGEVEPDRAAAELLEPESRWNPLLNALSTYINGVELDRVSARDFARYHETGVNWRVRQGYGALVAAYGAGLDVTLNCPATVIDHTGTRVRVETRHGAITARAVVVTVPTDVLAAGGLSFRPALPDKVAAAAALPLGLANKLFLKVDAADDLPRERRVYGAIDRAKTGSYHLRPFGLPVIEGYFGGALARALEAQGDAAVAAFALDQLAAQLGNGIRKRLAPLAVSAWGHDPFARGSYSCALPGKADARAALASPVDDRLFFAGEAASAHDFSTAHGAYRTGVAAAAQVTQALSRGSSRDRGASRS